MNGSTRAASACCLVLLCCAGCVTVSVQNIPSQEGVYPTVTAPDAPLVLAVPGLVVPGLRVTQEQHFGYLVKMLAAEGIPCRIIAYNTRQDPVSMRAALFSPELSIAWTRVGPAIADEFQRENRRRASLVIKNVRVQYERFFEESSVLQRLYARAEEKLDTALEAFNQYLIDPSKQYPRVTRFEGPGSPYYPKRYEKLRAYAAGRATRPAAEREENKQFFITYAQYHELLDVEPFFVTTAASLFGSPRANDTLNFARWIPGIKFVLGREYGQIAQTELGVVQHLERIEKLIKEKREGRYPIDAAHALFFVGANGEKGDGYVDQPSAHLSRHTFTRLRLVDEAGKRPRLEEVEHDALPAAPVVPLPVMHLPEKVMWGLGGGHFGAAYMVKRNPVFPYLLSFVKGDQEAIRSNLARSTNLLRQFMIECACADTAIEAADIRRTRQSDNIDITGRYFNRNARTVVWTGYFKETGITARLHERLRLLNVAEMIPGVRDVIGQSGAEKPPLLTGLREHAGFFNPVTLVPGADAVLGMVGLIDAAEASRMAEGKGAVNLAVPLRDGRKVFLECTVYPGCISFFKIAPAGD
ncbi:MAG: hypothetical protein NT045_03555 [Candidatus Aureabacteria bacterium]|nr:hypothetical protein [Candidatus Auribacterota bacterium]